MQGSGAQDLFEGLKAALDLAVHISPLTLLGRIALKRCGMDRHRLIRVSARCVLHLSTPLYLLTGSGLNV